MRTFISALLVILIAACSSLKYTDTGKTLKPLSIIFSSNRFNSLETCDCVLKKIGGLDREWNLTSRWKNSSVGELVAFTSGTTFLPPPKEYKASKHKLYKRRSETMVEGLSELKLSALSPSINDFRLGMKEIADLKGKARFPFVSANIVDAGTKALLFQPKISLEQEGIRIVVIGLSGAPDPAYGPVVGATTISPIEALQKALEGVDPKDQLVVLLSSLTDVEREQVQLRFPQIHLILGANHQSNTTFNIRQQTGSLLYLHPTGEGRTLSLIELEMKTPITTFFNPWLATTTKDVRQIWENRVLDVEKQLLNEKLKPAEREELLSKKTEFQTYLQRTHTIPLELNPTTISYRATTVELDENYQVPENPVTDLLKPYRREPGSATAQPTDQSSDTGSHPSDQTHDTSQP
ncbi:MAG: hypothetical protein R3B54_01045 [Bdellovibrionota bacterium]